jgi:hypothetical protein
MTTYDPATFVMPPPLPVSSGPKMSYELGEKCWIFAGIRDADNNHVYSPGKVVFWFDLPDLAQRFYVIRINDREFMHLMTRDATVMSPTADGAFPFQRTRFDEVARPEPKVGNWRAS